MSEKNFIKAEKKDYEIAYEAGLIGLQDYLKAYALELIRAGVGRVEVRLAIQTKLIEIEINILKREEP
jgi:hypothetical protein